MAHSASSELDDESGVRRQPERRLRSLDDMTREIADRRLRAEFGKDVSGEKFDVLRETPDRIEDPRDFAKSAAKAGFDNSERLLGHAADLELPAHIRRGEVPQEIATLMHEDLHRLTHPETRSEMGTDPVLRELYEGITEYFTERAAKGLHEHNAGECYVEQVAQAKELAAEVGEPVIRKFFFGHEMNDELAKAIGRISSRPNS